MPHIRDELTVDGVLTAAVGGDLSGNLPSPTVINLQGRAISTTSPSLNYVLTWNGTQWAPAVASGGTSRGVAMFMG